MTGRLTPGVMWDVKAAHYLKKRPESPFAHVLMGWVRLSMGDPVKADRYFDDAITKNADYYLAYTGKICVAVYNRRYRDAGRMLTRYAGVLNFDRYLSKTVFYGALSTIAHSMITDAVSVGAGGRRKAARPPVPVFQRALQDGGNAPLMFIRYCELLYRSVRSSGQNRKCMETRGVLAPRLIGLPGVCDDFRLGILADIPAERHEALRVPYTFDRPVSIPSRKLDLLFERYVCEGRLKEPRLILMGLRKDGASACIANKNKWLFLRLCYEARRNGETELLTACELHSEGWWGDPLVRAWLAKE